MPRVVVYATFTFKPELVEAAEALMKEVTRGAIQEEGCEYHCGIISGTDRAAVTFDMEAKNKMRVFEIYKSPAAVDAHIAGTAFGKFQKWCEENDGLVGPLQIEKHHMLEDAEKGIIVEKDPPVQ